MNPLLLFGCEMSPIRKLLTTKALCGETKKTATGNPLMFKTNVAKPLKSLTVPMFPVQDLHGQDAPYPAGGGKNLLPKGESKSNADIVFTVQDNGEVVVTGTATSTKFWGVQFTLPAGSYTLNGCPANGGQETYSISIRDAVGGTGISGISGDTGSGSTFTLTESLTAYVNIRIASGYSCPSGGLKLSPMIRLSSVSDATFAPYSNICPITGWTGVNVSRTGVNLWDEEWESGYINAQGQDSSNANTIRSKNYIPITPNTSFYVVASDPVYIRFYDSNKQFISGADKNNKGYIASSATDRIRTTQDNCHFIRFYVDGVNTYSNNVSINYPSTDTDYHAYTGQTYPVTFPALGKNLCPVTAEVGTAWNGSTNSARARLVIPCKPSTKYTLSMNGTNGCDNIYRTYSASVPASSAGSDIASSFPNTFTTGEDSQYIVLAFSKTAIAQTDIDALKLQLELGETASTYEPYTNTCYCGTLTVNDDGTGTLVVDSATKTFTGDESEGWVGYSTSADTNNYRYRSDALADRLYDDNVNGTQKASWLKSTTGKVTSGNSSVILNNPQSITFTSNNVRVYVYVPFMQSAYDLTEWKNCLASNPLTVIYKLATPVSYQLSNLEVINALKETNVIWSDTNGTNKAVYLK